MNLPIDTAAQNHTHEIAFDDGELQIMYGELRDKVAEIPSLNSVAISPGEHIAWCPQNDRESYLTFWAIQMQQGVACPISTRFPLPRRDQIVDQIDAKWLSSLSGDNGRDSNSSTETNSNLPSTILLSSGSTGPPKAIVHSMDSHITSAMGAAKRMPLRPGDRWLWSLPLYHISGLSILVRCAVAGATVVGIPGGQKIESQLLEDRKVTHVSLVTTQLRRLLDDKSFPPAALKNVLLGGSRIDPELVTSARQKGISVLTTYGLTETASQVTTSTNDSDPASSGQLLDGRELKISPSGEILIRGTTLCLGYYEDGRIQSVVDEEGWFHTRDLGSMSKDKLLYVQGRFDNMFISGGENIFPENIERAIMSQLGVNEVVVVPKPDQEFGARPVAFVDGEVSANWEAKLRTVLSGFEIPIEMRGWPDVPNSSIKINRKYFQQLASK